MSIRNFKYLLVEVIAVICVRMGLIEQEVS